MRFPEAVEAAVEELMPNRITDYLYDLSEKFNGFYTECHVSLQASCGIHNCPSCDAHGCKCSQCWGDELASLHGAETEFGNSNDT